MNEHLYVGLTARQGKRVFAFVSDDMLGMEVGRYCMRDAGMIFFKS